MNGRQAAPRLKFRIRSSLTHGGFLRSGKSYPVTDILRGLIVEVEGRGCSQGPARAEKIRFNESDMRAAITTDTRVNPVEANQEPPLRSRPDAPRTKHDCSNSLKPACWISPASSPSSPGMASLPHGKSLNSNF